MTQETPKSLVSNEWLKKLQIIGLFLFIVFLIALVIKHYEVPFALFILLPCSAILAILGFIKAKSINQKLSELMDPVWAGFVSKLLNLNITVGHVFIISHYLQEQKSLIFFYPFVLTAVLSLVVIIYQKIGFNYILSLIDWLQLVILHGVAIVLFYF